ncbi:MAG: hypothetical protein HFJ50_01180 [Clostridia bacterium]|nr:hypothetical protein [Clostridia bacterium]
MKKVITAVGNEELNKVLKEQKDIKVEAPDIQYQEGIIEALEEYKEIDIVVLNEEIIGELELEDLIRSIVIIKNDVQIILITNEKQSLEGSRNIIKIVSNKTNYVKEVVECITDNVYINQEKATKSEEVKHEKENIIHNLEKVKIQKKKESFKILISIKQKIKSLVSKKKKRNEVISVIGAPGVRKD